MLSRDRQVIELVKFFRTRLGSKSVEVRRDSQVEPFFDDGYEHVDGYSDPDLSFNRVFGDAEESFDTQMLFDPFEEQLDSPAQAVELSDCERGQDEVVGQKDQSFPDLGS